MALTKEQFAAKARGGRTTSAQQQRTTRELTGEGIGTKTPAQIKCESQGGQWTGGKCVFKRTTEQQQTAQQVAQVAPVVPVQPAPVAEFVPTQLQKDTALQEAQEAQFIQQREEAEQLDLEETIKARREELKRTKALEEERTERVQQVTAPTLGAFGSTTAAQQAEAQVPQGLSEQRVADFQAAQGKIATFERKVAEAQQAGDLQESARLIAGRNAAQKEFEQFKQDVTSEALDNVIELAGDTLGTMTDEELTALASEQGIDPSLLKLKRDNLALTGKSEQAKIDTAQQKSRDSVLQKGISSGIYKGLSMDQLEDITDGSSFSAGDLALFQVEAERIQGLKDEDRALAEAALQRKISTTVSAGGGGVTRPSITLGTGATREEVDAKYSDGQKLQMSGLAGGKLNTQDVKALAANGLNTQDVFDFLAANKKELSGEDKSTAQENINKLDELLKLEGFESAVGAGAQKLFGIGFAQKDPVTGEVVKFTAGSDAQDFLTEFTNFKATLMLPLLKNLKGAMSDKDLAFIQAAATSLSLSQSEDQFKSTVKTLQDSLKTQIEKQAVADPTKQLPKRLVGTVKIREMKTLIKKEIEAGATKEEVSQFLLDQGLDSTQFINP